MRLRGGDADKLTDILHFVLGGPNNTGHEHDTKKKIKIR